jgi:hypothetical protein
VVVVVVLVVVLVLVVVVITETFLPAKNKHYDSTIIPSSVLQSSILSLEAELEFIFRL